MKKEDLIKAYEEIPFSGQLKERVYKTLESQKKSHVRIRRWKTAIATLLVCVLAVTACTAAAIHYDWFAELYPETAGIVEDNINRPSNSVENDHLRMSGESSVFTGNAAILFLKIEALDKEGKEWMRLASRGQLSLDLELCGPEGKTGAAGSTKLLEQYSDGDTWYYKMIHMEGKADRGTTYEKSNVRFCTMENEKNDV